MQLSFNFYPTPAHQQLQFPEMNHTNNKDRGQHNQKMISSSEEEEEETKKNYNNKWQGIRSTKREKIFNQHTIVQKNIEKNN
jgi:hypothetical protein